MKTKVLRVAVLCITASILFFISTGATSVRHPLTVSSIAVPQPTGTLHISEELFNVLKKGTLVQARLTAPHEYTGLRPVQAKHLSSINDPCDQDWIDFNDFWKANIDAMQAWANENCSSYYGCWQGQCYNIIFVVNPSIPCNGGPSEYKGTVRIFEH